MPILSKISASILALSFVMNITGCTRPEGEIAKVKLAIPLGLSGKVNSLGVALPIDKKACYGVHVTGPSIDTARANACAPEIGITGGFISEGNSIIVEVPKGEDRSFELFIHLVAPSDPCPQFNVSFTGISEHGATTYMSGVTAGVSLQKDEETVNISVNFLGESNPVSVTNPTNCGGSTTTTTIPASTTSSTSSTTTTLAPTTTTTTSSTTTTTLTPAVVSISDPGFDFGIQATGSSSDHTFTITNSGGTAATAMSATGLSAPFTFKGGGYPGTGGTCGTSLTSASSCSVVVTYAPTTAAVHSATVSISYNDGISAQSANRPVLGTGALPASLAISDGPTYDFGSLATGSSTDKTFTVSNSGGVTAVALSGSGLSEPFAFKGGGYPGNTGTCGTTLTTGSSCTIVVTYSPVAVALYLGLIQISYIDGAAAQGATGMVRGTGNTVVSGLSSISGGGGHSCALVNGVLKCWGKNANGQLGDGTIIQKNSPTLINSGTAYSLVSAGYIHTCGITTTGILKCWGDNQTTPSVIDSGTSYSLVSAGSYCTCGITSAGVLKCWGSNNSYGQIGDGTTVQKASPTVIDSGTSYSLVSAGVSHTCGITSAGVLKCWGYNGNGELGDGTTTQRVAPVVVDAGTTYSYIATGVSHSCGITMSGVLKCWGWNSSGELGDGTTTQKTSPAIIDSGTLYSLVSAVYSHTCGITSAGVLKCWGVNGRGQIGDGTISQRNFPTVIDSGTSYSLVSTAYNYTCGISAAGVLKCWGDNSGGQIGNGTTTQKLSPILIESGISYLSASASYYNTCGVTAAGVLKCWGDNRSGQIGDGTTSQKNSPTVIDSGTSYVQVSASYPVVCGITSGNVLKCWGYNGGGQVGDGTNIQRTTPTIIDSGTPYSLISTGNAHTCGLTTSNALKCWGANSNGQLGDGTIIPKNTPTLIDGGTSYSYISVGDYHTCGITTTGVLKCWGDNSSGELGNGTSGGSNTAPTVIDSGTYYSSVSAGYYHTCGITSVGILRCWGYNSNGQLGDGTVAPKNTATSIDSSIPYSSVTTGNGYSCGITTTGALKCWGQNIDGELGDGTANNNYFPVVISP